MKNKKYKHSTTTRSNLSVCGYALPWRRKAERTPLLIVVLQLTYAFYEKMNNIWPVEELWICFSTTYILVLPTVFEQHDAEVSEVRVYTCCRFWHWLGDCSRVKNWIFVTSCYVMAGVHIWKVKYNFNRMFCAISPQSLRTAFYWNSIVNFQNIHTGHFIYHRPWRKMTAEKNPVFSASRWLWLVEYGCGR